jgi:hypothetical protein
VDEKKRLAARKFISVGAEWIADQLAQKNDPEELWGTAFEGKYVRWQGKFERKGMMLVEFIATTGDYTSLSCKDFDPAHDASKFDLDNMPQWTRVSVEGRLDEFKKQLGKNKVEFMLTECVAKKL